MAETQRDIAEYQTDHDLLVVLNERVGQLTTAVEKKNSDHEERLRSVERKTFDLETSIAAAAGSTRAWRVMLGTTVPIIFLGLGWIFVQFYTLESTLDKRISNAITMSLTNYSLIRQP